MHLSKTTLAMVSESLQRSRRVLKRAERQIEKCRAGLDTIRDLSMRTNQIVNITRPD